MPASRRQYWMARAGKRLSCFLRVKRSSSAAAISLPSFTRAAELSWMLQVIPSRYVCGGSVMLARTASYEGLSPGRCRACSSGRRLRRLVRSQACHLGFDKRPLRVIRHQAQYLLELCDRDRGIAEVAIVEERADEMRVGVGGHHRNRLVDLCNGLP